MSTEKNGPYAVVVDLARHTWGIVRANTLGAHLGHSRGIKMT